DGQPKVLDFGIARLFEPDGGHTGTITGQLAGTPVYMSPEQASLSPDLIDARSDIYTLGVIGYAILAGKLPHDPRQLSIPAILHAIREEEAPPISRVEPALAGDVETIRRRAMAREPDARYQSAQALADDIRRFLRHEPISARPPSAGYQLSRFARRNPGLCAALAGLALALIVGAVTATLLYVRAERARAELLLRNDALIVLDAEHSLPSDPTRAVARLATLSPRASWDDALAVARAAAAEGVARRILEGHTRDVRRVDVGPVVATASYDATVRLWDLDGRPLRVVP